MQQSVLVLKQKSEITHITQELSIWIDLPCCLLTHFSFWQPSVLETQEPKDVARVTSLIQVYIPQAFLKDSSGGELTYTIPKDADKSCFKGLCQALDQNLQHLHLTGYGISDTTLEEVRADVVSISMASSRFRERRMNGEAMETIVCIYLLFIFKP